MGNDEEGNGFNDNEERIDNGNGEAGLDALDAMESRLQAKIKRAVGKQVEKLIEVADQVDDPTDALAILWQGSEMFRSMKMQRMSQIDDTLPQPAALVGTAFITLPLPLEDLLPAAFQSMDTASLFQALMDERQSAVGKWMDLTKPILPPDNAEIRSTFGDVVDIIEQVGVVHYEIVRAGLFLHILLTQLHDKYGALPFLTSKGLTEQTLLRYNAHTPHLALGIEEQELHGVQTLLAIIARVHSYLMSPEFYNYLQKKEAAKTSPEAKGSGLYSASINLVRKMTSSDGEAMKKKLGKDVKGILQTSANFLPVAPVVIDMAEGRDPKAVLNELSQAIQGLVEKGMEFILQLKKVARTIDFNIFTLQFGEATPLQDNRTMMQKLRKDIFQQILKDLKTSATLQPKLLIKHMFVTQAFAGRYGAGPAVDAVSLDPGEEREVTHETTVTTKRMTEESDSIFDAKTTTVKDSLEKNRQNQLQQTNTDTSEVSSYLDRSLERSQDESLGVSASVNIYDVVNVDVDYDISKSVTEGVNSGSSQTTNNTRETAVTNTEGVIQNHTEEVTANRERTQTKTSKQEEELSQKDKEVRKIKNPNRASPTTIIFCKLIQNYNTVTSTPGFKVLFGNGSIVTECEVSSLKDSILDRYIKPGASETRRRIWEFVKASAKVVDYSGRLVDLLDEAGAAVRLRSNELYFNLLKRQSQTETAEDLALKPYKKQLKGVILSTRQFTLPQCGLLRRAIVGEPALDETEQTLVDLEIEKTRAQTELVKGQVEDRKAFRTFFQGIKDPDQKIKAGYLLMTPPGDIIQKGTLSAVTGIGGNDPTGLEKLKVYLRGLKLDV